MTLEAKITVCLFVDDYLIYSKISCHEDQLAFASALQSITNWCTQWKIKINQKNTVCVCTTRKTKNVLVYNHMPL